MIYYRGRWLIEPEIKALLTKLEDLNKELRSEADRVLRENAELKGMLKEARELILAAIYVNYKQTNAAAELVDKISKKIGRRLE